MSAPMRFRKRPVEVEAMRWPGGAEAATPVIDWILRGGGTARYHEQRNMGLWVRPDEIAINTLEGTMVANPGDWVICGVAGEFHPCRADIFAATYELAVSS